MTQQTTGYVRAYIQPASSGFDMWDWIGNGDDVYRSPEDLIHEGLEGTVAFHSHEDIPGMAEDDQELIEAWSDITGNIHNEPDILVAVRHQDGEVDVIGINRIACREQADGTLIPV